jgi:hypothetical protein
MVMVAVQPSEIMMSPAVVMVRLLSLGVREGVPRFGLS